ncbi:uncharacterized protein LOC135154672 [Lytechinus pictus]|uniref:uncharacterized protein LOC135154672 n=1 Tax=Lytechinus pictus TaxID=7653 RepID=UPI0030B9B0D4
MGSPVSAVIANMYMEAFENTANNCPLKLKPKIWKHYVDDTFITVNKHSSNDLMDFMNRRETTIRFTAKHESNGSLAFLDTEVHRQIDGTLKTTVYRKPTRSIYATTFTTHMLSNASTTGQIELSLNHRTFHQNSAISSRH